MNYLSKDDKDVRILFYLYILSLWKNVKFPWAKEKLLTPSAVPLQTPSGRTPPVEDVCTKKSFNQLKCLFLMLVFKILFFTWVTKATTRNILEHWQLLSSCKLKYIKHYLFPFYFSTQSTQWCVFSPVSGAVIVCKSSSSYFWLSSTFSSNQSSSSVFDATSNTGSSLFSSELERSFQLGVIPALIVVTIRHLFL